MTNPKRERGQLIAIPSLTLRIRVIRLRTDWADMSCYRWTIAFWIGSWAMTGPVVAADRVLTERLHHVRVGTQPEWTDFPAQAEAEKLELKFPAKPNATEWSIRLRQQDVRQTWKVLLNGREVGRLRSDEIDMISDLIVAAGTLKEGDNTLVVEQIGKAADDIRVGEVVLHDQPLNHVLSEGTVDISVTDATAEGKPTPLPCRLTILNRQGSLASIGAKSNEQLAVRPGVIYTANGQARFGLPAGDYTIYAGRGFEYGIDSQRVSVRAGEVVQQTLSIRREVPTPGWVSCDTHIHTLTHSGHGDATEAERMITIAGEGIELPIATDHNIQIDYQPSAQKLGVRQYFTPVIGNEVTTAVGHFNVFPLSATMPAPDYKVKDWKTLFTTLIPPDSKRVVILNHPRDVHSGYRPFGPEHHIALTGENLDGWELRANAMELINSGAHQTDMLQPVHDWMALLNRGFYLTPVGSSDSHDVSRYIVGQGRTYIRCADKDAANLPVSEAVDNFLQGRVNVSCGLLTELTVNNQYGPGDLVPTADEVSAVIRVLGPGWTTADRLELYANGLKVREEPIAPANAAGVKWKATWTLPRFKHDVHLVAVASGPGVSELYWPIGRPYQATSPVVNRRVMSVTGATWIDGDGDGKRSSAADYARRLWESAGGDATRFIASLHSYDEAVATQAASVLKENKIPLTDPAIRDAAKRAGPPIERAFQAFEETWRQSQIARSQRTAP